jgi:hypothetical protein
MSLIRICEQARFARGGYICHATPTDAKTHVAPPSLLFLTHSCLIASFPCRLRKEELWRYAVTWRGMAWLTVMLPTPNAAQNWRAFYRSIRSLAADKETADDWKNHTAVVRVQARFLMF